MGQLLLFFLSNLCSFFSYVGGVLVTNLFSANYNTWGAFVIIFLICSDLLELPQKCWHFSHNNRKWLKRPQSHFHKAFFHHHFSLFWCILCTATSNISSSSENVNNITRSVRSKKNVRELSILNILALTHYRKVFGNLLI